MSEKSTPSKIPALAYDEAGEWFVQHRESLLDDSGRQAFDAWLRASPQNVQAYLEISSTWEDVPRLRADWNPSADELIAIDRATANVVALKEADMEMSAPAHPASTASVAVTRKGRWNHFALAASLVAVSALAGYWWYSRQVPTYATGIGEQRLILLPDGSKLELNARSAVKLRFTTAERRIDLLAGQGLFSVTEDPMRQFVVRIGNTDVRALGTQFDVYRKKDQTIVTVLEGRVAVGTQSARSPFSPRASADRRGFDAEGNLALLSAGEQLAVPRAAESWSKIPQPRKTDVTVTTAWTNRRLVFESSPLSEVVEEFNRYNVRQLEVADPALENYRVSGVFSSTDPDPLLQFLRLQRAMTISESADRIRITQK